MSITPLVWNSQALKDVLQVGVIDMGLNGKEKDPEGMGGGGSTYDYGFRIYIPQIARFLSVDPLTKSYPMLTPYQFASNQPIWAIDLDGLERMLIIKEISGSRSFSIEVTRAHANEVMKQVLAYTNWTEQSYEKFLNYVYGEDNINQFESTLTIVTDDNNKYLSHAMEYDNDGFTRMLNTIDYYYKKSKGSTLRDGFSNAPFKSAGLSVEAEQSVVEGTKLKGVMSLGGNNPDDFNVNTSLSGDFDVNTGDYNKLGSKSNSSDLSIYLWFSSKKMKPGGFDIMKSETSLGTSIKFSHFRFSYATTRKDYTLKVGLGTNDAVFDIKINEKFNTKGVEYNSGNM